MGTVPEDSTTASVEELRMFIKETVYRVPGIRGSEIAMKVLNFFGPIFVTDTDYAKAMNGLLADHEIHEVELRWNDERVAFSIYVPHDVIVKVIE